MGYTVKRLLVLLVLLVLLLVAKKRNVTRSRILGGRYGFSAIRVTLHDFRAYFLEKDIKVLHTHP